MLVGRQAVAVAVGPREALVEVGLSGLADGQLGVAGAPTFSARIRFG